MKKIYIIFILTVVIFLYGCGTYKVYEFKGYNSNIKLELNKDGTFSEYMINFIKFDTIYGNWHIKNDTLILEINRKASGIPELVFNVKEEENKEIDSIIVNSKYNDSISAAFEIGIYLDDNTNNLYGTNHNGESIIIEKTDFQYINFYLCYGGGYLYRYKVKNKNSNIFNLNIIGDWTRGRDKGWYFKEKYLLTKTKIIPIDNITKKVRPEFALRRNLLRCN